MEQALKEAYSAKGLHYGRNRVLYNYTGVRSSEPSSVAIVATMHTLTRLILHLIKTTRARHPSARRIHPWEYNIACMVLKKFLMRCIMNYRSKSAFGCSSSCHSTNTLSPELVLYAQSRSVDNTSIAISLTDSCITDINSLVNTSVIPGLSSVVGYTEDMEKIPALEDSMHRRLVEKGEYWSMHVQESWIVLVLVGIYVLISVSLGLPFWGLLADGVVRALGFDAALGIAGRYPSSIHKYSAWYISLVGWSIQAIDALWFIFLGKVITWLVRLITGRPLWARMGKRTLVIVDTPCNHQLLENFVSKLFSQSYSFCSIDVHGASGLDHFVHRFTHRVTRGVLLAVGRPDGRLCCLSKSESATLLSVKQAAFIQNTFMGEAGAGPDIITIGHNPYQLPLPDCANITLPSMRGKFVDELMYVFSVIVPTQFFHLLNHHLSHTSPYI